MSQDLPTKKSSSSQIVPAFKELSKTAQTLNSASDNLNKVIAKLDAALKTLNLGVAGWVKFNQWSDEEQNWCTEQIGYDKISGKWGIALRSSEGNDNWPEDASCTSWLFSDAPRELRIRAVEHIPKLIEELNGVAAKFTDQLAQKTSEADELAAALASIGSGSTYSVKVTQVPPGGQK